MLIRSFWARNYRSLRDVRLDDLGPFNIFYGPNGAGKSNVLAGLRALFWCTRSLVESGGCLRGRVAGLVGAGIRARVLHPDDPFALESGRCVALGACVGVGGEGEGAGQSPPLTELDVEVEIDFSTGHAWFSGLRDQTGLDLIAQAESGSDVRGLAWPDVLEALLGVLGSRIGHTLYALIDASRPPDLGGNGDGAHDQSLEDLLAHDRLKQALFVGFTHPDHQVRRRYKALQELLQGPPLNRPPFQPVRDPQTGRYDLRETLPEPNPEGADISVDLAGLGIAQVYSVLAQALLRGTSAVAIEEPEAHLHAPSTGRQLRELLVRLVEQGHLEQLFIATHSNLFDLDPKGYYDVSLEDRATVIEPKPLSEIDAKHLYEPGPAKHAIEDMLAYLGEEEVVFRRPDSEPVTAAEMLKLLQEDDEVALAFLRDVHGAAVRAVRVRAQKKATGS